MAISRRTFLTSSTSAFGGFMTLATRAAAGGSGRDTTGLAPSKTRAECVLLDLKDRCGLPESIRGYETALAAAGCDFVKVSPERISESRTIIIPGCVTLEPREARRLADSLAGGATIILESGAAFADTQCYREHQRLLAAYFGLSVASPVDLWVNTDDASRVPYVDYLWPKTAKVRDFSRVVPLQADRGETIARAGDMVIAGKRRVGKGTLVFLGSPLGPVLLAGDREAHGWLRAALTT